MTWPTHLRVSIRQLRLDLHAERGRLASGGCGGMQVRDARRHERRPTHTQADRKYTTRLTRGPGQTFVSLPHRHQCNVRRDPGRTCAITASEFCPSILRVRWRRRERGERLNDADGAPAGVPRRRGTRHLHRPNTLHRTPKRQHDQVTIPDHTQVSSIKTDTSRTKWHGICGVKCHCDCRRQAPRSVRRRVH